MQAGALLSLLALQRASLCIYIGRRQRWQKAWRPGPEEDIAQYRGTVKNESLASYYAAVTRMDAKIGEVLEAIDRSGQKNNTIVMFLSDNGGSGNGGNAPLRGSKSTMWEGGLRVPFIVRWPGHVPAGLVNNGFLTSLEILPSLLLPLERPRQRM